MPGRRQGQSRKTSGKRQLALRERAKQMPAHGGLEGEIRRLVQDAVRGHLPGIVRAAVMARIERLLEGKRRLA